MKHCPDCRAKLSSRAIDCPRCGYRYQTWARAIVTVASWLFIAWLAFSVGMMILVGVVMLVNGVNHP